MLEFVIGTQREVAASGENPKQFWVSCKKRCSGNCVIVSCEFVIQSLHFLRCFPDDIGSYSLGTALSSVLKRNQLLFEARIRKVRRDFTKCSTQNSQTLLSLLELGRQNQPRRSTAFTAVLSLSYRQKICLLFYVQLLDMSLFTTTTSFENSFFIHKFWQLCFCIHK